MAAEIHSLRDRAVETEKITINLGYVDLGRIDLLVQEGFYSNRTDFIRTAIRNQLERLVPVHRVTDMTAETGNPIARELALVKVAGKGEKRVEALRLAEAFRAQVVDASTEHFIFEITGRVSKVDQFLTLMQAIGLVEVARTGVAAITRGPAPL
jgi:acetolactate synthase-1/3 small subunit